LVDRAFEFVTIMRLLDGSTFDVMLEAKSKDLALLRLRRDLVHYAPDVARRFGLGIPDEVLKEPRNIEIIEPDWPVEANSIATGL
jgi:UV DNA damage endonuclease